VCALLARARRARGCSTPGDDRLETRVYAVKRYAYRLGHVARSARFATSIEQLVVGLAPVMGWRRSRVAPSPGRASFARTGAACSAGSMTCRQRSPSPARAADLARTAEQLEQLVARFSFEARTA
jgi:hypothetical protein